MSDVATAGWNTAKVAKFRAAFMEFLKLIYIDSKDKGGNYCLADGLYDAQFRFMDGIFDGLANDIHDFKILKSRQLGISTIAEALFVFYLGMFPGIQAACIYDSTQHLRSARMRIRNLIKRLPKSLNYGKIAEDSRDMLSFDDGTVVNWIAAGVRETESSGGLGRGSGCNLVWASEVSSWKNDEGTVSLIETFSETYPDRLYIWESTARGFNAWHDMWMEAKKDDLHQRGIFIGWWARPDHQFSRTNRKFERYGRTEPTDKELKIIEDVKKQYAHEITMEQLAWYRWKIDPTRDLEDGEKKRDQFKIQEQPSTEIDCFQSSGSTFFDHQALTAQSNRIPTFAKSRNFRYDFGHEFPQTVILPAYYWREVELRVWDAPQAGLEYVLSADPAFGRNPDNDRSAIQVLACYADCVEQVAEYASATTNTTQFAWVIASIAAWYRNVRVIVEIDGPGEAVWKEWESLPRTLRAPYMRQQAQERGLTDVFNNVRNYVFNRPDSMAGKGNNWQWKTGNRKEAIMEAMRSYVSTGQAIIKSSEAITEMRSIARDGASIEAPSHKHDDRVLAYAIGIRAWEDEVRPGLIARNRTKANFLEAQKMTTAGRYATFMENTISNMFQKNAQLAKQAARNARLQNIRRR